MKFILILIVALCSLFTANAQVNYRSEADIIAPAPTIVYLGIENSTEFQGENSITLKAGFEVSQNGNTSIAKYFRAYIFTTYKPVDIAYSVLEKDLNAGFASTVNKVIYFIYDEKYNTGTLNYKIYDYARNTLTGPVLTKSVVGRNYYQIDMSTISGLAINTEEQKYFIIEVTNDKNEVQMLRFKYILMP